MGLNRYFKFDFINDFIDFINFTKFLIRYFSNNFIEFLITYSSNNYVMTNYFNN